MLERSADWRLLLQLDGDDAMGWLWGASGFLYYAIREQDLRRGDFDGTWMVFPVLLSSSAAEPGLPAGAAADGHRSPEGVADLHATRRSGGRRATPAPRTPPSGPAPPTRRLSRSPVGRRSVAEPIGRLDRPAARKMTA
jgi:hypothetical protein